MFEKLPGNRGFGDQRAFKRNADADIALMLFNYALVVRCSTIYLPERYDCNFVSLKRFPHYC